MTSETQITPNASKHHGPGKIEGSWKGMKKYLEQDMLCNSLRGSVSYYCTWHPKFGGLSRLFSISLDGTILKKFNTAYAYSALNRSGMQIKYIDDVDNDIPMQERDEYTSYDFAEALEEYRHIPVQQAVSSANPIIRMFAIVDRRIGKRTLTALWDHIDEQPDWLKPLYQARMKAESISPKQ